jgi:PAS domain S-box-containing protein
MNKKASDTLERLIPVPLLLAAILIFALMLAMPEAGVERVYYRPYLPLVLNTLLITAISFWIAWQSLRGYLASGFIPFLVLGCALLASGITAFIAGLQLDRPDGTDIAATVNSLGFLLSALLHLINAFLLGREEDRVVTAQGSRRLISSLVYMAVFIAVGGIWVAKDHVLLPRFFDPEVGSTMPREIILTAAILLLAIASYLLLILARQKQAGYLRWYSFGLALIAVGLIGSAMGIPGSPLSWAGRASRYLGNLYLLAAAVYALREARRGGLGWEDAVREFFRESEGRYRTLVESARSAIISVDRAGRVFLWNPSAQRLFGYAAYEVMGQALTGLIATPGSREVLEELIWKSPHGVHELTLRRKDGSKFSSEFTVYGLTGREEKSLNIRDVTERKRAEAALENARDSLECEKDILQAVMDGAKRSHLVYLDRNFNFLRVNETYAATCGFRPEEMIGKNHFALYPHEENEAVFTRVRDTGVPAEYRDKPFEFPDQPERGVTYWDWTLIPIKDGKGQVEGLVFSLFETTERKRAEVALQKAKDELEERVKERTYELYAESIYARNLIEASLDPLVTISIDGKITDVNRASVEATGVPAEQLIGSDFSDYFTHPENASAGYMQVLQRGFVRDYPLELRHRDGHVIPVLYNASTYRDETGQIAGVFAAARDISRRLSAENALKAERQRFFDVLETLPAMILLLTPDYHVAFANKSFRDRFGESEGRHCYEYCFGKTEPCDFCETYNVLKTGQPHQWECRCPDGSVLATYDFPFKDTDGSPLILEMDLDITNFRKAEAALIRLTHQLEKSRDDLRDLASELVLSEERERKRIATVLHDEVCQTLAVAKMRIDMLKKASVDNESKTTIREAGEFLAQSIQEARALMNEVGNPLLFEMGVKAACTSLAERLMASHPIRIRCDIQDSLKDLDPDVKVILYQVIQELLNNIVKHSGAHDAGVTIRTDDGLIHIEVRDDGVGFDPRRLGAPTAEGGFGLFSIQERLKAFNAHFGIESATGRGTVVRASIPSGLEGRQGPDHGGK